MTAAVQMDPLLDDAPAVPKSEAPAGEYPDWVRMPPNLMLPSKGRQIQFVRFRAGWTDLPDKGDRQCICWTLSDADERVAISRSMGEDHRVVTELTKRMIRAIDGIAVDESGINLAASVDTFWFEIGQKCRNQLTRLYSRLHSLSQEEMRDFFENCIAVRTVG